MTFSLYQTISYLYVTYILLMCVCVEFVQGRMRFVRQYGCLISQSKIGISKTLASILYWTVKFVWKPNVHHSNFVIVQMYIFFLFRFLFFILILFTSHQITWGWITPRIKCIQYYNGVAVVRLWFSSQFEQQMSKEKSTSDTKTLF